MSGSSSADGDDEKAYKDPAVVFTLDDIGVVDALCQVSVSCVWVFAARDAVLTGVLDIGEHCVSQAAAYTKCVDADKNTADARCVVERTGLERCTKAL